MFKNIFLWLSLLLGSSCAYADSYMIDLSQVEILHRFDLAPSKPMRIRFHSPKAFHRYDCNVRSNESLRTLQIQNISNTVLDVVSDAENGQFFLIGLDASTNVRINQQYTVEVSHEGQGIQAITIHCQATEYPREIVLANERQVIDEKLNEIISAITAYRDMIDQIDIIDSQPVLNDLLQRIHQFDPYRHHPRVGVLYSWAWDMINAKISDGILKGKRKVEVVSAKDDNQKILATPVENAVELQMLARKSFLKDDYILGQMMADGNVMPIDMDLTCTHFWNNGEGFVPIGTNHQSFSGQFMGNQCVIWGLWIKRSNNRQNGLFGVVKNSSIDNLKVDARVISGWASNNGSLVGKTINSQIHRCVANHSCLGGGESLNGGLVGYAENSHIQYCNAYGRCQGGKESYNGGLVGHAENTRIRYCHAHGHCEGGKSSINGGLMGCSYHATIQNCHASGHCEGGKSSINGALVGGAYNNSQICYSYASGSCEGGLASDNGGLIGYAFKSRLHHCAASGICKGMKHSDSGMLAGCIAESTEIYHCQAFGSQTITLIGGRYHNTMLSVLKYLTPAQITVKDAYPGWTFLSDYPQGDWVMTLNGPRLAYIYKKSIKDFARSYYLANMINWPKANPGKERVLPHELIAEIAGYLQGSQSLWLSRNMQRAIGFQVTALLNERDYAHVGDMAENLLRNESLYCTSREAAA